ncbi:MAG TPA: hypothetical protein VGP46_08760 [Acidimicrobiales bacterium]|nr:hypothetical protein [Acidimicrobiales bacterium]
MGRRSYRRGYMGRNYHVTGGHEAKAQAAEHLKAPTRLGVLALRLLGYRGPVRQPKRFERPSPHHERGRNSL